MSGDVWMVSEGVWGGFNTKSVGKKIYWVMILRYCLFFQCPVLHKHTYVLACLNCVWEWMGSEGVWGCINTKYFGTNLYSSC